MRDLASCVRVIPKNRASQPARKRVREGGVGGGRDREREQNAMVSPLTAIVVHRIGARGMQRESVCSKAQKIATPPDHRSKVNTMQGQVIAVCVKLVAST